MTGENETIPLERGKAQFLKRLIVLTFVIGALISDGNDSSFALLLYLPAAIIVTRRHLAKRDDVLLAQLTAEADPKHDSPARPKFASVFEGRSNWRTNLFLVFLVFTLLGAGSTARAAADSFWIMCGVAYFCFAAFGTTKYFFAQKERKWRARFGELAAKHSPANPEASPHYAAQ